MQQAAMQQQVAAAAAVAADPAQAQRMAAAVGDPAQMYLYQQTQLRYLQHLQQMQMQHQPGQLSDEHQQQLAGNDSADAGSEPAHLSEPPQPVDGSVMQQQYTSNGGMHHGHDSHERGYHDHHVSLPPLNLQHHAA